MSSECALLLLAHNAPVKIKNAQGWSPLAEAISYGDRQMSELRLCSNEPFAPLYVFYYYLLSKWLHHCILNPNEKDVEEGEKPKLFTVIQMCWTAA